MEKRQKMMTFLAHLPKELQFLREVDTLPWPTNAGERRIPIYIRSPYLVKTTGVQCPPLFVVQAFLNKGGRSKRSFDSFSIPQLRPLAFGKFTG